jgi:hypothetical protein
MLPNTELLRKCFVFYSCIGGEVNIIDIDYGIFDELKHSDFSRMLKPMLTKQDKFDEKKSIEKIKEYLKSLLALTVEEKQFITTLRNKEYTPELLFDNKDIISRIANHPMAKWRIRSNS